MAVGARCELGEIVGFDGDEQFAAFHPQRQKRAEIANRFGSDFAFPLGDQITVRGLRNRITEFHCKPVPNRLIIGHTQRRPFPKLGAFAAAFGICRANRFDA